MYDYRDKNDSCKILNEVLNHSLGGDYIYRVFFDKYMQELRLTFNSLELLEDFMSRHVSKYTCDTSSLVTVGLTVFVTDSYISKQLIDKSIKRYEDDASAIQ